MFESLMGYREKTCATRGLNLSFKNTLPFTRTFVQIFRLRVLFTIFNDHTHFSSLILYVSVLFILALSTAAKHVRSRLENHHNAPFLSRFLRRTTFNAWLAKSDHLLLECVKSFISKPARLASLGIPMSSQLLTIIAVFLCSAVIKSVCIDALPFGRLIG